MMSICLTFLIMPLGNQIVDKGKLFFMQVFQLIDEEGIVELEYHHFVMDLGFE